MREKLVCENNKNKSNGGFSVVELIICVAILALASYPLIKAFSMAAYTNKTSQSMQNATAAGEGVMEELKASTIAQLEAICAADSDKSINKISEGKYEIEYDNVTSNSGEKFHVEATIDATGTYASSSSSMTNAADANTIELPVLAKINQGDNAAISKEINKYDDSAVARIIDKYWNEKGNDFQVESSSFVYSNQLSISNKTKETTITITRHDVTKRTDVDCVVKYQATITKDSNSATKYFSECVYSASFKPGVNPGVYIFYNSMPEYWDQEFKNNTSARPLDFYLFKNEKLIIKTQTCDDGATPSYTAATFADAANGIKSYLMLTDHYTNSGSTYYYDAANTESIEVAGAANTVLKTFIGGTSHVYNSKSDKYIYQITMTVYNEDGTKSLATLTSNKSVEKTNSSSSSSTSSSSSSL